MEGEEAEEGRWPASAACESAVCQAWMLAL